MEHPEQYRVMLMGKSHFSGEDYDRGALPGMRSFMALVGNVQECMEAGVFVPDDPVEVATVLWAAVHGITSLRIAVPGFPTFRHGDAIVDRVFGVLTPRPVR